MSYAGNQGFGSTNLIFGGTPNPCTSPPQVDVSHPSPKAQQAAFGNVLRQLTAKPTPPSLAKRQAAGALLWWEMSQIGRAPESTPAPPQASFYHPRYPNLQPAGCPQLTQRIRSAPSGHNYPSLKPLGPDQPLSPPCTVSPLFPILGGRPAAGSENAASDSMAVVRHARGAGGSVSMAAVTVLWGCGATVTPSSAIAWSLLALAGIITPLFPGAVVSSPVACFVTLYSGCYCIPTAPPDPPS
ncbi:hypothetical protein BD779DRAFT_1473568 [Infundibulicybe gibba]|nr:hypothetical protein BD779DRAFT_1473568 [Infundibulicybe gibba]